MHTFFRGKGVRIMAKKHDDGGAERDARAVIATAAGAALFAQAQRLLHCAVRQVP